MEGLFMEIFTVIMCFFILELQLVPGTATSIHVSPTNVISSAGQKLCISCECESADDRPSWIFQASKPTSVEERIARKCSILKDDNWLQKYDTRWIDSGRCVLIIKQTSEADSGVYTCANIDDIKNSSTVLVDVSARQTTDYCGSIFTVSPSAGTVHGRLLSGRDYFSVGQGLLLLTLIYVMLC